MAIYINDIDKLEQDIDLMNDALRFIMERVWVFGHNDISDYQFNQIEVYVSGDDANPYFMKKLRHIVSEKFEVECRLQYISVTNVYILSVDYSDEPCLELTDGLLAEQELASDIAIGGTWL